MSSDIKGNRFTIRPYSHCHSEIWDDFVNKSRNGTFLLTRGYADYHAERFADASLMVYEGERLVALFIASADGETVQAHGGLTYGGLILPERKVDAGDTLDIMYETACYYADKGFRQLVYRAIPHIYHRMPSEDDVYALFRLGATLSEVNMSTTVDTSTMLRPNENSRRAVRRAVSGGLTISETDDLSQYWMMLMQLLGDKYHAMPTHTLDEIKLLAQRYPDNIRLSGAFGENGVMEAGALLYITPRVVHTQYLATTERGRKFGALSLLLNKVIERYKDTHRYIDFGTSNERHGQYLNRGLISQKSGLGGRYTAYQVFTLDLCRYKSPLPKIC